MGKHLTLLPNQRLLFYFEASRVHSGEAEAALFLVTRRSVTSGWFWTVRSELLLLLPSVSGLFFFNESVVLICPLATPRLRRSLRRNWWRSVSPAGRPTETLLFLIPNSPTLLGQKPSYKRKLANRRSPITFSGYFLSKALPNKRSGRCLQRAAGERVQKKKNFPQVFSAPCKKADAKQSDGLACARGLSHWRLKKRKKKKKANTEKHSRVFSLGSTFRRLWEGVPGVPVSFHGAFSQFCP